MSRQPPVEALRATIRQERRVSDVLREDNLAMHRRLEAAGELARAQLGAHGVDHDCRLCQSARLTLGILPRPKQRDLVGGT